MVDRQRQLIARIEARFPPGTTIPKPEAEDYRVGGWGSRRGERALIYEIPNHKRREHPHKKGVTEEEFARAHEQLLSAGEFTKAWFKEHLPRCNKDGGCNFTTIGGVFLGLGIATREGRGVYREAPGAGSAR